ncbi:hypothetical protein D9619_011660 [Psilocybe cf. subviscida]|uniref:Glucose receptor Git3 N-terminal domain-containing protein n=1 Tax=Psilocybe cf. subviscida TaxID=2480587 RepID=A0A8H5BTH9_9AGAR|nr:hypothetical protein D9619_011660 [Psilocybe cf. subviscida]
MFTFPQRLGLFIVVEASILSIIAVSLILCLAVYKWLRRTVSTWGRTRIRSPDASDSSLFLNLMVADLVQATGNIPTIWWMADAHITEGTLCTAQAAIKQVGIVGVSMTSLAIAIHTFSVLVLRWRAPRYSSSIMIAGVWIFAGLVIGIPNAIHRDEVYYGDTGYWCWIEKRFKAEQIVTEYLWVWVAGLSMIVLYTIMFLVIRGWFIIDNGIHWHKNYNANGFGDAEPETDEDRQSKAIANLMLFYPAVYIFCVLPNSIARWMYFTGTNTPYQFTLFANTLFALSGTFNVLLFFITRPQLVLGPDINVEAEEISLSHQKDISGHSTRKLGHLPERRYGDDHASVDVHNDGWGSPQPDFDARVLPDHNVHRSPAGYEVSPLPRNNNPGATYLSTLQNRPPRSPRESSSLMENEDYGHLPS